MASALKRLTAVATAAVATIALAASPAKATDGNNYVFNAGAIGSIGVIHIYDGVYTFGNYDQLLPQGKKSNDWFYTWYRTEGVYIGPGYCADIYKRANDNQSWGTKVVYEGGGSLPYQTNRYYNWMVVPFHKQPGLSCYAGPA